jgi:hypothetical protein
MLKNLANKYYWIVSIAIGYVILILLFKQRFINWITNTSPDESVTDADAYAQATYISDMLSNSVLLLFIIVGILSVIFLFSDQGKQLHRPTLMMIVGLVAFCFLSMLLLGG